MRRVQSDDESMASDFANNYWARRENDNFTIGEENETVYESNYQGYESTNKTPIKSNSQIQKKLEQAKKL